MDIRFPVIYCSSKLSFLCGICWPVGIPDRDYMFTDDEQQSSLHCCTAHWVSAMASLEVIGDFTFHTEDHL